MRPFFIVLLVSLPSFLVVAQKDVIKFGDVTKGELTMKRYSNDTSAAAVILFDIGSAVLARGTTIPLTYKRHVRIKIFRTEAFGD